MSDNCNTNQPWGQQRNSYGQLRLEQDSNLSSGYSSDIQQHHTAFPYNSTQQFQPPGTSDVQTSSVAQSTFPQSQRRPERQGTSFGSNTAPPLKQTSQASFGSSLYDSNANHHQTDAYGPRYADPQDLSWNSNFQNNNASSSNPSNSGYSLSGDYSLPNNSLTLSPAQMHKSLPHDDNETDAKEGAKAKSGTCARCKTLRVKCEFKTDTDPCKRCFNGGHDCVTPGRKKRRIPRREHYLLNQIREQAAQIRDLMAQLEAPSSSQPPSTAFEPLPSSASFTAPGLSPTSSYSYNGTESDPDAERNKAVEDWIAKAKQSFQEFDEHIGIGGAGLPKSYFVKSDLEHSEFSEDEDYVNVMGNSDDDDYEIAVEHFDGDEANYLRHKSSASSLGTNYTGTAVRRRRKSPGPREKPVLPGAAAPFGFFYELNLKTPRKRGSSAEAEDEDKAAGIANTNFFRSSAYGDVASYLRHRSSASSLGTDYTSTAWWAKEREDAEKQVVRGTDITSGGTSMINVVTDPSSSLVSKTRSSPPPVTPPLRLDESDPHQTRNSSVSISKQNEGGPTTGSRSTECQAFHTGNCVKGQNRPFSHEPKVLPEDDAGDGEEKSLEDEASEAAFVVCWPQGRSTPSSTTARSPDDFPCFSSSWDGGCILSVHDSDLVDIWIDLNYDHWFLVLLREKRVGGPVASMLSVESPALTIFGAMSVELIRMASELAELSSFPVIVRPLGEDPSRFRNHKQSTLSTTPNTDGGGDRNTSQGASTQSSISVDSSSQNQRANNHADGAKKGNLGKQRQDDTGSEDEGEDPSDPDPPPPPVPPPTKGEIIHRADITLTILINNEDKGHFLRVITNAKTYPLPNLKTQSENRGGKKVASEPSIQGHVYLETRSSESVQIDVAAGSLGFLANDPDYLRTEYLVSLGYDQPPRKFNIENSSQTSKSLSTSFGLVGGKPTAAIGLSAGKLTGTMTGLADEEVAKPWIVSPQHGNYNWETDGSCYRSLSANINRSPPGEYQALKHPMVPHINVEYGMAVEVAESINKEQPPVSFVYRHQIHCWVAVGSRAKVRGMIVLTAHYIPDIRTEKPLWISSRPSMNVTCKDIQQNGSSSSRQVAAVQDGNAGLMAGGTSDDRFIFSAATTPEPDVGTKHLAFFNRLLSGGPNSKARKGVEQVEPVPMHGLVFRGWNRKDIGWDHREQRWYHPVWQKLDPALLPDESRAKWKLDWES